MCGSGLGWKQRVGESTLLTTGEGQATVEWLRGFWPDVYLLPLAIDYGLFAHLMLVPHGLMLDGRGDLLFDGGIVGACGGGGVNFCRGWSFFLLGSRSGGLLLT